MENNKKKQIILVISIIVLLISVLGVTFAVFSYSKVGSNEQLITGDIYMHYKESNTLVLDNALPSSTYDPTKYFEFTVDGKNTNTKYDIIYDVTLNRGDAHQTRTERLADKFLKFTLMEKKPGESEWTTVVDSKSYSDLSSGIRVWKDTIEKNTMSEVVHTYRLYMWIDNSVVIGTGDGVDYNQTVWNNDVYASVKVTVTGDFEDKEIYRELTGADKVLASINSKTTCNPSTAVLENKTMTLVPNLTGQPLSDCVSYATSSMGISSNAEAEAFCQGTGEVYGSNFQGWLDGYNGGFPPEFITYFEEHNIITVTSSTENVGYDEDGAIYLSGSNDCVDFNYVWWSGKMWRITAIYDDGSMKMVTDNNITSIAFNDTVTYYDKTNGTKSYMFQWLNEDFLDTLYNQGRDVIDTTKSWNATMPADTNITTKPAETDATMIPTTTSPVGLLNSYEYYKSYQNTTYLYGYLNIGYNWWLLNPYNSSYVWNVSSYGSGNYGNPTDANGSRPSIYLKSGISLSGSGTKESPYPLAYDYDEVNTNDKIYTRHSGEYVKLSNNGTEQLFRIVEVVDNKTKIVAMDYADNKAGRKFATSSSDTLWGSGTTTGTDTWYTYLNGTYYPNLVSTYGELFDSATYYLGTSGDNYKLSVCANTTSGNTNVCDKTTQTGTFNIGLLRYGEMFATQQGSGYSSSIDMWLINRYSASSVWLVSSGYGFSYNPTNTYRSRPSVHLKSTVKILSGTGTELDPYIVGL